jgi:hypothetical protein
LGVRELVQHYAEATGRFGVECLRFRSIAIAGLQDDDVVGGHVVNESVRIDNPTRLG